MLDEYLSRADVKNFISRIKNNSRYYSKEVSTNMNGFATKRDISLFTFYDALFKFKVIIDDVYLFDEYISDLEKLYKKIDNFDAMSIGINKLICRLVGEKLNIKDYNDSISKKEIISYVYNKYIEDGYYIYGFNNLHEDSVINNCFMPEIYNNIYSRMLEVNKIFAKYNVINIIEKDFSKKSINYTDSLFMGCYYSVFSPMYFFNFLLNNSYFKVQLDEDISLLDDYSLCTKRIKRFMKSNNFCEKDYNYVMDVIDEEWKRITSSNRKIDLVVVKRNYIESNDYNVDSFNDNAIDIYDIVDRIISNKKNNVLSDKVLYDNYEVISFDYFDLSTKSYNNDFVVTDNEFNSSSNELKLTFDYSNAYGRASILIILGSLLISFGVISTIFMIFKGGLL